ncbi:MAG: hypothetical protein A2Z03_12210 [Chloroflexi bacterium RBG_16_56_8]|nr:MAG: hypothetical protein A2Z03_12210 [Chloroflexi bacterium RBG_16_56_8]
MTTVEEYIDMLERKGLLDRVRAIHVSGVSVDLYPPGGAGRSSSVDEPQPTNSDPLAELKELLPNATFPRELT